MPNHPLATVFITHRPQLRQTALKIVGDAQRADDLLHDAYLRATACPRGALNEPVSYCHRIVRNLAIDDRRRANVEGDLFEETPDELDARCPCASPERHAIGRQHIALVCQALAALPERPRRAFELHQIDGLPLREVATQLGLSLSTTHASVQQALACCRAALPAD
ncbi:sigma-70 family RNA polymerase sigma factor [Ideonella sp. DXS29W]|uniref:Sigma-70 family RNA polymerase sigma factor n=1 Tax=Ideonella lacteola TaxID=2984193 RepID=A0ABU9BSJ3_9BURK